METDADLAEAPEADYDCECDWPETCDGLGVLICEGCGGDLCICPCGGELSCPGCGCCDNDGYGVDDLED